jgi:hypothetical protein
MLLLSTQCYLRQETQNKLLKLKKKKIKNKIKIKKGRTSKLNVSNFFAFLLKSDNVGDGGKGARTMWCNVKCAVPT